MIQIFRKFIIGGETGKREMAWFVFKLWAVAFVYFVFKEAHGIDMPGTLELLRLSFIPVLGVLLAAHGMEWATTQLKRESE